MPPGSCLALAGPSGAGKTSDPADHSRGCCGTYSRRATCGDRVWLDTASDRSPCRPRSEPFGYLFQEHALFGHLHRVAPTSPTPCAPATVVPPPPRALELLDRFGVAHLADARPATLSRRGASARGPRPRARPHAPEVLLLDEPLSALDTDDSGPAASRELAAVLARHGRPRRSSSHTTSPRRPCSATEIGVIQRRPRRPARHRPRHLRRGPPPSRSSPTSPAPWCSPAPRGRSPDGPDADRPRRRRHRSRAPDRGEGAVAVSVFPWEISIAPAGAREPGPPATTWTPRSCR